MIKINLPKMAKPLPPILTREEPELELFDFAKNELKGGVDGVNRSTFYVVENTVFSYTWNANNINASIDKIIPVGTTLTASNALFAQLAGRKLRRVECFMWLSPDIGPAVRAFIAKKLILFDPTGLGGGQFTPINDLPLNGNIIIPPNPFLRLDAELTIDHSVLPVAAQTTTWLANVTWHIEYE